MIGIPHYVPRSSCVYWHVFDIKKNICYAYEGAITHVFIGIDNIY